jgi:hypothetical protein
MNLFLNEKPFAPEALKVDISMRNVLVAHIERERE